MRRRLINSSSPASARGSSDSSQSSGIGIGSTLLRRLRPACHSRTSEICGNCPRITIRAMSPTAEVVICGAGIAGVAAAYHLAVRHGVRDIVVVDERPPLTLTSDKSAECYRNWWPGPGDDMVAAMNRSIDLLDELARESG